jgi:hypothetical protein
MHFYSHLDPEMHEEGNVIPQAVLRLDVLLKCGPALFERGARQPANETGVAEVVLRRIATLFNSAMGMLCDDRGPRV